MAAAPAGRGRSAAVLVPLRALRGAAAEFFFDLPRMVLLNLFWFATAAPALLLAVIIAPFISEAVAAGQFGINPIGGIAAIIAAVLTLALAGPGTAAIYHVTNRLANGSLLEISRFWWGFRHFFWRGWGLALLNVGVGALLALNVVFYWSFPQGPVRLLALVFAYLIVIWVALQGYLFSLLVEMDQSVRLVLRNALFLTVDNLGMTLALLVVNLLLLLISVPPWTAALALPLVSLSLTSNVHNKVIVDAVGRYRAEGRVFTDP